MTQEIKRILKNTRRTIQISPSRRYVELFNKEDIQTLLDYITNLQQENERLKEDNLLIKNANKLVSDNLHNYKSRCQKANEWIHKHQQIIENMRKEKFYILNLGVDDLKEFKNIINGGNNSE